MVSFTDYIQTLVLVLSILALAGICFDWLRLSKSRLVILLVTLLVLGVRFYFDDDLWGMILILLLVSAISAINQREREDVEVIWVL